MSYTPSHLIRIGMLAVIRDVQDYIESHSAVASDGLNLDDMRAYLLAQLILAGGYDDGEG
jgi:hypothetical protein